MKLLVCPFKPGLLGVFQKLIASKANDHQGFYLLNSIIENMPPYVPIWMNRAEITGSIAYLTLLNVPSGNRSTSTGNRSSFCFSRGYKVLRPPSSSRVSNTFYAVCFPFLSPKLTDLSIFLKVSWCSLTCIVSNMEQSRFRRSLTASSQSKNVLTIPLPGFKHHCLYFWYFLLLMWKMKLKNIQTFTATFFLSIFSHNNQMKFFRSLSFKENSLVWIYASVDVKCRRKIWDGDLWNTLINYIW